MNLVSEGDLDQNLSDQDTNTITKYQIQEHVISKFELPNNPLFAQIEDEPSISRRELVQAIEDKTDRTLILYYSNPQHPAGRIDYQDVNLFHEILRILDYPKQIDLMIHSGGGIIEATEKLVKLIWSRVESFRVIVMEFAKSAATSLSLASQEILMSFMGELGPIDPLIQVGYDQVTKQPEFRPAWSYIHAIDILEGELKNQRDPRIVAQLLSVIDPTKLDIAKKAIEYSKTLAEEWMTKYMGLKKNKARNIAAKLCDSKELLSHGRVIDINDATKLIPKIQKIDTDHELWPLLYQLHTRALLAIKPPVVKLLDCRSRTIRSTVG